ncbi:Chymotrypsin-like elastase family member 1, partial [Trichinella pseudospiralis]
LQCGSINFLSRCHYYYYYYYYLMGCQSERKALFFNYSRVLCFSWLLFTSTMLYPTLDAFQCGFRFTSLVFHDHLLFFIFGEGSVGMYKDCIGTMMLTNESSVSGDLILTSKYCLDSGSMQNVKVLPSHFHANYVHVHGYGVRKIIAPAEKQSWKELQLPYNFALLQLSEMIPISSWVTPVCLPSADMLIPVTSPCFLPKTTYHMHSGFAHPFTFVRMPSFWCMARSKDIVITSGETFCAVLQVTSLQHYNHLLSEINTSLFEGAPLLCLYQNRFYQVGIFDWLKIFRSNTTRPIAVFSRVAAIVPLIEQAIVGNISNEYYSFMSSIDF